MVPRRLSRSARAQELLSSSDDTMVMASARFAEVILTVMATVSKEAKEDCRAAHVKFVRGQNETVTSGSL